MPLDPRDDRRTPDQNVFYLDKLHCDDVFTSIIKMITTSNYMIHHGRSFFINGYVDVPAGDVVDFRFITPDTNDQFHMFLDFLTQSNFFYWLYENITITTPGTDLSILNKDRNSANTSQITTFDYIINTNIGNADDDTDITNATIIQQGESGSERNNTLIGKQRQKIILKSNTGYSLRLDQNATAARWVNVTFDWYEVINGI